MTAKLCPFCLYFHEHLEPGTRLGDYSENSEFPRPSLTPLDLEMSSLGRRISKHIHIKHEVKIGEHIHIKHEATLHEKKQRITPKK